MATIGLYDIDFNHGGTFSLSLPLMKAWTKLIDEGHVVIMMKPYEKTGRYTKIFYFKESQSLKIPNSLTINTDKGKMIGYGFYGENNLLPDTAAAQPSFTPYDINSDRIKNKTLYKSIKGNSIIDWREKDFTGVKTGSGITYVNDRDFLKESDWSELFNHFDNNIQFIHTLNPCSMEQAREILSKPYVNSRICVPINPVMNVGDIQYLLSMNGVTFDNTLLSNEELFAFIFFIKTFSGVKIRFRVYTSTNPFTNKLLNWGMSGRIESFAAFCGKDYNDTNKEYYYFKHRRLLRQNPTYITPDEAIKELTF